MKITYAKKPIKEKPQGKNAVGSFRYANVNVVQDKTIEEIAADIGSGQTFHVGIYDAKNRETINKKRFLYTELIALDFDNDQAKRGEAIYEYEDIYERALHYGIEPSFTYFSFSHTDELPKFRFVYQLEEIITAANKRKYDILFDMFRLIFPELDENCSDVSRLFYGTNKGVANLSGKLLNEINLLLAWQDKVIEKETDKSNLARTWKSKAKQYGVNLNPKGKPYFEFDEHRNTIKPNYISDDLSALYLTEKSKARKTTGTSYTPTKTDSIIRENIKNWQSMAYQKSSFYRGFVDGDKILQYDERMFLISNLHFIKGGIEEYKKILERHIDKYEEPLDHYLYQMNRILDWCTLPINYEKYSIDDELSSIYPNLLMALKRTWTAKQINEGEKLDMNIMVDNLFDVAKDFAESHVKIVKGIKAETGIGKTEMYINMDFSQYKKVLIALPTHALANEVELRFAQVGKEVVRVRQRPDISSAEYWRFLKAGFNQKANQIWEAHFAKPENQTPEYFEYIDSIAAANSDTTKIVIATHEYSLLKGNADFDFIIYDEDVCLSAIKQYNTSLNDLHIFASGLINKTQLQPIFDKLKLDLEERRENNNGYADKFSQIYDGFNIDVNTKNFKGNNIPNSNVIDFFHCAGYAINGNGEIRYSVRRKLDFEGKKVLVLSATLSEIMFDEVFRDYLSEGKKITSYGTVQNRGTVKQDMVYTYSKSCLESRFDEIVNYIKWRCPDWQERTVITFKSLISRFKAAGFKVLPLTDKKDMAFGSTEGIDALKGDKIMVVGKFNYDDTFYKLSAKALNFDIDYAGNPQYPHSNIHHNGFEFPIMTYENEQLRALHFYYMEHELVQAIGRARAVREESADVMVFCDLPLLQPDEFFVDKSDKTLARQ